MEVCAAALHAACAGDNSESTNTKRTVICLARGEKVLLMLCSISLVSFEFLYSIG
jgi:hypothetical protein